MKLINKGSVFSTPKNFILAAISLALMIQSLGLGLPAFISSAVAATDYAKIVRLDATTPNSTAIDCQAYIKGPSKDYDWYQTTGLNPASGTEFTNDIYGEYAYQITDEVARPKNTNMVSVYFLGKNEAEDSLCLNAMGLVQNQESSTDKKIFYGWWFRNESSNSAGYWEAVKGTVVISSGAGVLNITTSSGSTFSIKLNTDESSKDIFTNTGIFPSTPPGPGSGNTSSGPCSGLAGSSLTTCLDTLQNPRFTDIANIIYKGETYTAEKWSGDNVGGFKYYLSKGTPARKTNNIDKLSCRPYIQVDTDPNGKDPGNPSDGMDLNFENSSLGSVKEAAAWFSSFEASNPNSTKTEYTDYDANCNPQPKIDLTVGGVNNMSIVGGYFSDSKIYTLIRGGGNNETPYIGEFTKNASDPKKFEKPAKDGCSESNIYMLLEKDPATATLNEKIKITAWNLGNPGVGSTCENWATVSNVYVIKKSATETPPAAPTTGEDDGTTDLVPNSCYTSIANVFGWVLCPLFQLIDVFAGWAENVLQSQLIVDLGDADTRKSLEAGWQQMARIASSLLVIIGLVMVTSTAFGFKFFDAYTIKKVLPRLVIGAVGIWFSWALITTYVDFMNFLGQALGDIILTQFANGGFSLADLWGTATSQAGFLGSAGAGLTIAGAGIFAGLAGYSALAGGPAIILLLALTTLTAFVVLIFVLTIRQALIIFLIVLAPIAIAFWILPNTKGLWSKWFKLLSSLLLMYPMIIGTLAAGKVFAAITANSLVGNQDVGKGILGVVVSVLSYVAPMFLVPGMIKSSSAVMGKLSGGASKFANKATGGYQGKLKSAVDSEKKSLADFKNNEKLLRQARGDTTRWDRISGGNWAVGGTGRAARQRAIERRAIDAKRAQIAEDMYNPGDEMAELERKERAGLVQREFNNYAARGMLEDRDHMRDVAAGRVDASLAQRQAALQRLTEIGDDVGMRQAKAHYDAAGTSAEEKGMWRQVSTSSSFASAFKDKAPDIIKGDAAFDDIKSDSMASWSKETMGNAIDALQRKASDAAAIADPTLRAQKIAEADAAWTRFGQSVSQVVSDPRLSGRMSNETLGVIANNNAAISVALGASVSDPAALSAYRTAVGKISNAGTIS